MTVIAYDGLYVAADRLIVGESGMRGVTRKLEIHGTQVMATAGAADHGETLCAWFKDPTKMPFPVAPSGGKDAYLYVFEHNHPIMCFQTWPIPILFPMTEFAAGSGGEIARTALHLGRDAREAAKVATELNCYCGMGVEYVDLSELATVGKAVVRPYAA